MFIRQRRLDPLLAPPEGDEIPPEVPPEDTHILKNPLNGRDKTAAQCVFHLVDERDCCISPTYHLLGSFCFCFFTL